jgi:hypothetical protein
MPWSEFLKQLAEDDAAAAARATEEREAVDYLAGMLTGLLLGASDQVEVAPVIDDQGIVTGQLDLRVPQLSRPYRLTIERLPPDGR